MHNAVFWQINLNFFAIISLRWLSGDGYVGVKNIGVISFPLDEMDNGVDQLDGQERTQSPGCEQRDAGREEERDAKEREAKDRERLRVKLPQRSDMICGFATLKGFSVYILMYILFIISPSYAT